MPDRLFIRIIQNKSNTHQAGIVNESGQVTQEKMSVSPKELQKLTSRKEVVLIIPGLACSWLSTNLPKASQAKMEQALPFALEEQLVSDSDDTHFVLIPPHTAPQSVIVIAKKQMRAWVKYFHDVGIPLTALLPDSALISAQEKTWKIWLEADICHLILDEQHRYSCEPANLDDFLLQCLQDESLSEPEEIIVENHKTSLKSLKIADILPEKVKIIEIDDSPFSRLMRAYTAKHPANCLQKEFAPVSQETNRPRWRLAAFSLAAAVSILIGTELAGVWHLQKTVTKQNATLAAIYHRIFPNSKTVISPKLRIERALKEQTQQTGNTVFQEYLATVSPLLKRETNIKVESLRFQADTLTLRLSAKALESIQQLLLQLRPKFDVALSNTSTTSTATQTDMILRRKG